MEGQLSLEDLWEPAAKGADEDESVRRDGSAALGSVAAGTIRSDPGSGQLLLDAGRGSGPADLGPDAGAGGRRSTRRGPPGEGGPAERGPQSGGGDRPAGACAAATGARSSRGPGGTAGPGGAGIAAGDSAARRPAVGAGERRADGTGPGQLAHPPVPQRFRPKGQDDLAPSGTVVRVRANLAALSALRALQHEGCPADPTEQAAMARWSGWGAAPEVFDDTRQEFAWARGELAALLTPEELAAAARNTLNAHYTGADLVKAMWDGVRQLGFTGGQVLEPGCGSGNFIGFAPESAQVTGVELDPITAGIAAALYPDAQIRNESFADTRAPEGSYDLTIGNVPFGAIRLNDRKYNRGGHRIHNPFLIKSLPLTRPRRLVARLTPPVPTDPPHPAPPPEA